MGDSNFKWWLRADLNRRHKALQASALPAELQSHTKLVYHSSLKIAKLFTPLMLYNINMLFDDPYKNINGHKVNDDVEWVEVIDPLGKKPHSSKPLNRESVKKESFINGSTDADTAGKVLATFFIVAIFAVFIVMGFTFFRYIKGHYSSTLTQEIVKQKEYNANINASLLTKTEYSIENIGKSFSIERGGITFQETKNIYAVSLERSEPDDRGYTSELELARRNHPMDLIHVEIAVKESWPTSDYYEDCRELYGHCDVIEPLGDNKFDLIIYDYAGTNSKHGTYKLYRRLDHGDILISYTPSNFQQSRNDSVAVIKEINSAISNLKENVPYAMDMGTRVLLPFGYYISSYHDIDKINFKDECITFTPSKKDLSHDYKINVWTNGYDNAAYTEKQQFKYLNATLYEASGNRAYLKIEESNRTFAVEIHYDENIYLGNGKDGFITIYIKSPEKLKEIFDEIYASASFR